MLHISDEEYQQLRTSFDLCSWINDKLHELEKENDFEELYFERRGKNIKQLLEEAIPVSHLGLFFHRPWTTINVTCFSDNRDHDAVIEIRDPQGHIARVKIEVTTTEDAYSTMRRQALSRYGHVSLTGLIRREGRTFITEPEMVDIKDTLNEIYNITMTRLRRKLANIYDDTTAILVYVQSYTTLSARFKCGLVEAARELLIAKNPALYGIYFTYSLGYGVDGIRNNSSELY